MLILWVQEQGTVAALTIRIGSRLTKRLTTSVLTNEITDLLVDKIYFDNLSPASTGALRSYLAMVPSRCNSGEDAPSPGPRLGRAAEIHSRDGQEVPLYSRLEQPRTPVRRRCRSAGLTLPLGGLFSCPGGGFPGWLARSEIAGPLVAVLPGLGDEGRPQGCRLSRQFPGPRW